MVASTAAKDAEYLGLSPDSRHFTVIYDKFKLAAHIHSSPLAMPRDDTTMTVRVSKGVRAARGGNDSATSIETAITIPGRTSLRFSEVRMTVVDNARYEPEQILFFKSSSPVTERAFEGKVSFLLLPERSIAMLNERMTGILYLFCETLETRNEASKCRAAGDGFRNLSL